MLWKFRNKNNYCGPNEQRRPDPKEEETFEKRYKTLQGMYNADTSRLRAENQQFNQRVTQLEQLLSTLSTPAAKPQVAATKLVTDKDIEEYGDSIDVMRRVTEESLSARDSRIAELEQMLSDFKEAKLRQDAALEAAMKPTKEKNG